MRQRPQNGEVLTIFLPLEVGHQGKIDFLQLGAKQGRGNPTP